MELLKIIKRNRNNIYILLTCFAVIFGGVFIQRHELYQDIWLMEGLADGLFGENNRAFLTLGCNFIITGIIYLLSQTGLRLAWLHILLILFLFISDFIVCKIVFRNFNSIIKYVYSALLLLITTSFLLSYTIEYSAIAAYMIAASCLILFESAEQKCNNKVTIFGYIWLALGVCLRGDTVYFSIAYMGVIWLVKIITLCIQKKDQLKTMFFFHLAPFLNALCIVFLLQATQWVIMYHVEGDFYSWNSIRAQIDDFTLPDYDTYKYKYEEIGISKNDYTLLTTWNNLDEEIFTKEQINKIIELKREIKTEYINISTITNELKGAWNILTSNMEYNILLIIMIIFVFGFDKKLIIGNSFIILVSLILETYFIHIGKNFSTRHLLGSVIIVGHMALLGLIQGNCYNKRLDKLKNKNYGIILLSIIMLSLLFIKIPPSQKSIKDFYLERIYSEDTYFAYLKNVDKANYYSYTYNRSVRDYIESDKENLYYELIIMDEYVQQYPLTDYNFFKTAEVGAASNWGVLGQYSQKLSPIKNNLNRYGIKNPIPDLIKENVRVEVKSNSIENRLVVLNNYLKEHYYDDVDFSIIKEIGNCVITRFLRSIELNDIEEEEGEINIDPVIKQSDYPGIIEIDFVMKSELINMKTDEVYIQLYDQMNNSYRYQAIIENEEHGKILIPDTSINYGMEYTIVPIIYKGEGKKQIKFNELKIDLLS
ncbi:hypothetical protein [Schaedlerella arabinosiphila]|uniref:hypothetical protein n=1 Tax=Schaedlerella arabinosiphila TaxID=2044587 RepID=UPI0025580663|nr:hypothetical protein [Schaedlerella arabinosiphila]